MAIVPQMATLSAPCCASSSFRVGLKILLFAVAVSCCQGFVAPRAFSQIAGTRPAAAAAAVGITRTDLSASAFNGFEDFPGSVMAALDDDMSIDQAQAFSDSVNFTDGPVRTLGIVFGVVVLLLAGFKALTSQMDAAIEQVLQDFESTLKQFYPAKWEALETELQGLVGDQRDVKLLQLMDQLQEQDPEFMLKVKGKMAD